MAAISVVRKGACGARDKASGGERGTNWAGEGNRDLQPGRCCEGRKGRIIGGGASLEVGKGAQLGCRTLRSRVRMALVRSLSGTFGWLGNRTHRYALIVSKKAT